MNMSTWQLCPKCSGNILFSDFGSKCRICNGRGIISCLTGLPPDGKSEPFVPLDTNTVKQNPYTGGNYDIKQTLSGTNDLREEGQGC